MAYDTNIEWADSTWNPWSGCRKVSSGCKHCYMYRQMRRYGQDPSQVKRSRSTFEAPLKWKQPRFVFVCSWSDFFIQEADRWRKDAWQIMRRAPQHTYLVLTKRIERAAEHLPPDWPLPNVWLGVSVEDQLTAEQRIPTLLTIPAEVRFISCEPLLGPVNLVFQGFVPKKDSRKPLLTWEWIDWVIVGGESGPNARPMYLEWVRRLRDQCQEACVPFFFKHWGEWAPVDDYPAGMVRVGRGHSGRLLDGREWNERPEMEFNHQTGAFEYVI